MSSLIKCFNLRMSILFHIFLLQPVIPSAHNKIIASLWIMMITLRAYFITLWSKCIWKWSSTERVEKLDASNGMLGSYIGMENAVPILDEAVSANTILLHVLYRLLIRSFILCLFLSSSLFLPIRMSCCADLKCCFYSLICVLGKSHQRKCAATSHILLHIMYVYDVRNDW